MVSGQGVMAEFVAKQDGEQCDRERKPGDQTSWVREGIDTGVERSGGCRGEQGGAEEEEVKAG